MYIYFKATLTRPQIRKPINLLVPTNARIRTVLGNHQSIRRQRRSDISQEDVPLDENLVVGSRVDRLVAIVLVEVIVDVLVAETAGGSSGADVAPVVVVVGDVEVAFVDGAEGVGVAD